MAVIISIMQMSIQTLNVTASSLLAKTIGEKDEKNIKLISGNAVFLTIIISIITMLIAFFIEPVFPEMFNVDKICNTYLNIRLLGFIQSSLVTVLSGQQRTLGNQGNILRLRMIAVIMNLLLDIVAVKFNYGVVGVAFVTIFIDTIISIYLLVKSKLTIKYKFNKKIMNNIFNLFKWNFVERIVSRVDNFVFNILISKMGEKEYAVHVILIQIKDIVESFIQGFGDGITISVGIASGRKSKDYMNDVKSVAKKIIKIASFVTPVVTFIISIIIMNISLKEPELQNIFYKVLPILIIAIYTSMSATYYFAIIRGVREFKFLAQRNFITSFIKIIIATILAYTPLGIVGVWISYWVYCLLQKYLSKSRYNKLIEDGKV